MLCLYALHVFVLTLLHLSSCLCACPHVYALVFMFMHLSSCFCTCPHVYALVLMLLFLFSAFVLLVLGALTRYFKDIGSIYRYNFLLQSFLVVKLIHLLCRRWKSWVWNLWWNLWCVHGWVYGVSLVFIFCLHLVLTLSDTHGFLSGSAPYPPLCYSTIFSLSSLCARFGFPFWCISLCYADFC